MTMVKKCNEYDVLKDFVRSLEGKDDSEVFVKIAGFREDNGQSFYTVGEIRDACRTRKGWVWENQVKGLVELHMKYFDASGKYYPDGLD